MKSTMWTRTYENRRAFIGGSDARIIMGNEEVALIQLWREKRGEAEPKDLSGNLIVQLGAATEELNRCWYERNTGRRVTDGYHPHRPARRRRTQLPLRAALELVEDAFEQRLSELPSCDAAASSNEDSSPQIAGAQVIATTEITDAGQAKGIDKSILAVAAPRRYRNREHLRYVAQQACLLCGRKPSDPHHLGFTQPRALGRKVSDEFAVPLCRGHHRAVHRSRDECAWWRQAGIDPIKVARRLWNATRGMGRRPSQRPALPRPHGAAASSDPKNEEIDATATPQEEPRLPDVPG
jgi:hypothetical protein